MEEGLEEVQCNCGGTMFTIGFKAGSSKISLTCGDCEEVTPFDTSDLVEDEDDE